MALTVSIVKQAKLVNQKVVYADVTFDSSYPTGGEALLPSTLGLNSIEFFQVDANPGYTFKYDYANSKILAYFPRAAITSTLAVATPVLSHSAHAAGATPVTSDAATMAAHADHAAGGACTITGVAGVAAGAGAQVTNTTNLSSLAIRIMAVGF